MGTQVNLSGGAKVGLQLLGWKIIHQFISNNNKDKLTNCKSTSAPPCMLCVRLLMRKDHNFNSIKESWYLVHTPATGKPGEKKKG